MPLPLALLLITLAFVSGVLIGRRREVIRETEIHHHFPQHVIASGKPGIRCHVCGDAFPKAEITFLPNGYPVCNKDKEKLNGGL